MCQFTEKTLLNQGLRHFLCGDNQSPVILAATPDLASLTIFDMAVVPNRDVDPIYKYLAEVVAAIASAGYEGVDVVETNLPDGRIFSSVSINPQTPEGRALEYVQAAAAAGVLIEVAAVLESIRKTYSKGGL